MSFDPMSHAYDTWELSDSTIAPRTSLFSLEPIGAGTPEVESLTGYVARLAEAHSVPTSRLVATVAVPRLNRSYLDAHPEIGLSSLWYGSHAMNGSMALATGMVAALEAATGRSGLRFLTTLPWGHVLDLKGLLRRKRAWCSACYHEWRQRGRPIYEPLLWLLAPVVTCPRHGQPLETRCRYADCRQTLFWLATRSRPGHCSRCARWLGDNHRAVDEAATADLQDGRDAWVARVAGELLAGGASLETEARGEVIAESILRCARILTRGKIGALARLSGIDVDTVHQWRHGTRPGWRLLLRVCWRLGVSPLEFLTRPLSLNPRLTDVPTGTQEVWLRDAAPRRGPLDFDTIQRQLQAVIDGKEESPRSARETMKELGLRYEDAYGRYPDLMRQISARHQVAQRQRSQERRERIRWQVREAVALLHSQEMYPSVNRMRAILPKGTLRLAPAREAWLAAIRELGWDMGGQRMKTDHETSSTSLDLD
jgi:TniQ protein